MSVDAFDAEAGTINVVAPEFTLRPHATMLEMVERCPVARIQYTDWPVLSRYEDVAWALRHPEIFSSDLGELLALGNVRPMIPQQIDPPLQTRYRKILDSQFTKKAVNRIEPALREHARNLIAAVLDAGECEFDSAFAIPLPCKAFLEFMGLPVEEMDHFLALKNGVIRPDAHPADLARCTELRAETGRQIYAYFEDLIDQRTRAPREDLMTYLVQVELEGRRLSREEILDICYLFLLGGLDTVTATLGCNIAYLAENAEQRRRISQDSGCVEAVVEELLRWQTPVTLLPRVLKQPVDLRGVHMAAGQVVNLMISAADLDAAEFPRAGEVDFDRDRNRHLAFGLGPHRCLGSHLARLEVRVGLEEWHRLIPDYAIKPGEIPRVSPGIREFQYLPLVWPGVA